jgi:hypothetical protein
MPDLSKAVKLGLLEGQLLSGKIDRGAFVEHLAAIGVSRAKATAKADRYLATANSQAALHHDLKQSSLGSRQC